MAVSVSPIPSTELTERLLGEGIISMSAIARMLGELKAGRPVHPSTPYRWATHRVRLRDGSRLKLEAMILSGKPVSSRAALLRFIAAQQPYPSDNATPRSPAARRRASERAAAERARLGG